MDTAKKRKLEKAGWKVGSAEELLELSEQEVAYIELRLRLATLLRERRQRSDLTQEVLAKRIGSSQSRVAKMEAGDASVSLDLIIKSILALGVSTRQLGRSLAR